jgi:phytol kinase
MIRLLGLIFLCIASKVMSFSIKPLNVLQRASTGAAKMLQKPKNNNTKQLSLHQQTHSLPTKLGGNAQDIHELSNTKSSPPSHRSLVATVGISALLCVSTAAKLGILPGVPTQDSGSLSFLPYTDALIVHDTCATLLSLSLGYLFVFANTYVVSRDWVNPRDSRKLIHTFSAPLFILLWPLFSKATGAKYFAAIIPILNALRLYLASKGGPNSSETNLARAVSRSGNVSEALGGPFIYVSILATCILAFWRDSSVGIVALSALAAGDGVADLIGRRFGRNNTWPGTEKSIAGSLAFWIASTICATGLLLWMQYWGCLTLTLSSFELFLRLGGICFVSAVLELAPTNVVDDNFSVPISAGLLAALFI